MVLLVYIFSTLMFLSGLMGCSASDTQEREQSSNTHQVSLRVSGGNLGQIIQDKDHKFRLSLSSNTSSDLACELKYVPSDISYGGSGNSFKVQGQNTMGLDFELKGQKELGKYVKIVALGCKGIPNELAMKVEYEITDSSVSGGSDSSAQGALPTGAVPPPDPPPPPPPAVKSETKATSLEKGTKEFTDFKEKIELDLKSQENFDASPDNLGNFVFTSGLSKTSIVSNEDIEAIKEKAKLLEEKLKSSDKISKKEATNIEKQAKNIADFYEVSNKLIDSRTKLRELVLKMKDENDTFTKLIKELEGKELYVRYRNLLIKIKEFKIAKGQSQFNDEDYIEFMQQAIERKNSLLNWFENEINGKDDDDKIIVKKSGEDTFQKVEDIKNKIIPMIKGVIDTDTDNLVAFEKYLEDARNEGEKTIILPDEKQRELLGLDAEGSKVSMVYEKFLEYQEASSGNQNLENNLRDEIATLKQKVISLKQQITRKKTSLSSETTPTKGLSLPGQGQSQNQEMIKALKEKTKNLIQEEDLDSIEF